MFIFVLTIVTNISIHVWKPVGNAYHVHDKTEMNCTYIMSGQEIDRVLHVYVDMYKTIKGAYVIHATILATFTVNGCVTVFRYCNMFCNLIQTYVIYDNSNH